MNWRRIYMADNYDKNEVQKTMGFPSIQGFPAPTSGFPAMGGFPNSGFPTLQAEEENLS